MSTKNATLNMTTGTPLPLILRFCFPILLGNLMQQLYNMVDAAVVGQFVGTGALAAVGATGAILFLVIGFVDGMCSGLCIPLARSFGAGDETTLRRCLAHAVYLAVFFAVCLTVITSLLLGWLLRVMNTPADIFADSYLYLRVIFFGIPATIFYNLTAGILRALGNSRTPLYFLIFASCLNIVLDLILVLCFHLDVLGVGLATVYSVIMGVLLFFGGKYMTLIFLNSADPNLPLLMINAQAFIRANCSCYILLGTLTVYRFALQGLEYGPLAMVAGIFELAARSTIALAGAPIWGFAIIRFANPAAWVAACILLLPAYFTVMKKVRKKLQVSE